MHDFGPKPWPEPKRKPASFQQFDAGRLVQSSGAVAPRPKTAPKSLQMRNHSLTVSHRETSAWVTPALQDSAPKRARHIVPHIPVPRAAHVPLSDDAVKSHQVLRFLKTAQQLGEQSSVWINLSKTRNATAHAFNLLQKFPAATIRRSLDIFQKFQFWAKYYRIDPCCASPSAIVDFVYEEACSSSRSASPFKTLLRGLTWCNDLLGLKMSESLKHSLVQSYYAATSRNVYKRQITPATCALSVVLEKLVMRSSNRAVIISAGCFNLQFWAGLRFSDLQRCSLMECVVQRGLVRGRVLKSKNSDVGFAWAILASGFLGTHETNWVSSFFRALSSWLTDVQRQHGVEFVPDFGLPDMHPDEQMILPRPMSYARAASWLRYLMHVGQYQLHSKDTTLHGLKSGLITVGKQLGLQPDWMIEGHHSNKHVTNVYTRDDVWNQLRLQAACSFQVRSGWRQVLPVARGAQAPIPDLPFQAGPVLDFAWLFPSTSTEMSHQLMSNQMPLQAEQPALASSASSPSSSSSSSSDLDDQIPAEQGCISDTRYLLNKFTGVAHKVKLQPDSGMFVPACGARMSLPGRFYEQAEELPDNFVLCSKASCCSG